MAQAIPTRSLEGDGRLGIEVDITPKTYDIDFLGHVSNIVAIRWLEDLRLAFLTRYLPMDELMEQGLYPVLTRTDINYRRQIRFHDDVVGRMWIPRLEHVRIHLSAEILCNGAVAYEAHQEGVIFNRERQRPVRIPDRLREEFEAFESRTR